MTLFKDMTYRILSKDRLGNSYLSPRSSREHEALHCLDACLSEAYQHVTPRLPASFRRARHASSSTSSQQHSTSPICQREIPLLFRSGLRPEPITDRVFLVWATNIAADLRPSGCPTPRVLSPRIPSKSPNDGSANIPHKKLPPFKRD